MDESTEVRALLERAADTMGEVGSPPIAALLARDARRTRTARAIAILAAVVVVVGLAVGVSVTVSGRSPSTSTRPGSFTGSSPSATVGAAALARYRWRAMPAAPIPVRDDPAAVWTGTRLFLWGGSIGNTNRSDGALYDPATRRWTELPPSPLSARAGALVTVVDETVILWGSSTGARDGARFDVATGVWSMLPAAPTGTAVTPGTGQLITLGGSAVLVRAPVTGDSRRVQIDRYDLTTNRWSALPDLITPANHDVRSIDALVADATVYLWPSWDHTVGAGSGTSTTTFGTDAYRLTADDRAWQTTSVRPAHGFAADDAQAANGRVLFPQPRLACGPCKGGPITASPLLVDLRTGATLTVDRDPLGDGGSVFVWTGGAVLSYDSSSQSGIPARSVTVWSATDHAWNRLPSAAVPADASQGAALWNGSTLFVWGLSTPHGARVGTGGLEFSAH